MVWGIIAAVIAVVASAGVYYQQKKMEAQAAKQAQEAKAVQVSGHDSNRGLYTVYGQTLVGSTIVWKVVTDKEARMTQSGFTTISAATGSQLTTNKDHKNNRWLYRAVTLCNGPVTEITNVTIDDEGYRSPRFTNKTTKHFATTYSVGPTAGQNFSALRNAYASDFSTWASDAVGKGVAYAIERLYLHKDKPAYQGEPQTRYRVKGRALYDPRKDSTSSAYDSNLGTSSHRADTATTWEYSDNPVLALLDYMRSGEYGRGLDLSVIDIDSIAVSADKCDVLVDIPQRLANDTGSVVTYYDPETGEVYVVTVNGDYPYYRADQQTTGVNANKQRRFRINMAVDPSKEILDNIQEILNVFRGNLSYANGKYFVHMADVASPVLTLNDDDIIGGLKIANGDRSQRMNRATVKFINQAKQYKTDQVSWPSLDSNEDGGLYATYLTQDEDEKLHRTFTVKGCTDFYQAQDTAEFLVRDSRSNLSVSGTFGSRCFGLIPGDVVALDYDSSGFSGKYFRVIQTQVDLVSMNVGLQLKEYDSSVYTWNTSRGNEPLGLSWQEEVVNADPTNLTIGTIVTNTRTRADGSAAQTLTVPFSDVPEAAQYVEIGVATNNTTEYETHLVFDTENQTQAEIPIARDNQTYAVRARYFATNSYGTLMPSAYTETTHAVASLSGTKLDGIATGATQNTGALADLDTVDTDQIDNDAITVAKLDTSLESTNYQAGVSGWKLTKAGVFEAGDGAFRGTIKATVLDVEDANVHGTLTATNIAAGIVTADTLAADVFAEFDDRYGGSGGFYRADNDEFFDGSATKLVPLATVTHDSAKSIRFQCNLVHAWGTTSGYGGTNGLKLRVTFEYSADNSTWAKVPGSGENSNDYYERSATVTIYSVAGAFDIAVDIRYEMTGSSLSDNTAYYFRVKIEYVTATNAFTSSSIPGNSLYNGVPIKFNVQQTSGLTASSGDADTVDGLQASQFLRSDADDTLTGDLTLVGALKMADTRRIELGDDTDLKISHSGGGGTVENDTGNLTIKNRAVDGNIYFQSDDGTGVGTDTYFFLDGGEKKVKFLEEVVISDDLTVTGSLTITGNIDQYNVTDLDVSDKTITVNSGSTQSLSDGAGLIVDRGSAADASITWDETNDRFVITDGLALENGKNLKIVNGGSSDGRLDLANTTSSYDWLLYHQDAGSVILTVSGTGGGEFIFDADASNYTTATLTVGGAQISATKIGQWNTAYGWGDHSTAGYLTSLNFNDLSNKTAGTGDYSTTGDLVAGRGSGSIALTINDGKGNSNVTFNHQNGVPDQNGNAARIEVNTDSSTDASMYFEVKSGVTNGVGVDLTPIFRANETGLYMESDKVIYGSGGVTIQANDVDFIVEDTTDSTTNFIWRDFSGSKLYLGTSTAQVEFRSHVTQEAGYNITSSGNITTSGIIEATKFRVERGGYETALVFEDSYGNDSIIHSVNDSQGNYSIMVGVNDAGTTTTAGYGQTKILMSAHGQNGAVSLNAGPIQATAGSTANYSISIMADSTDNTIRVGNPNDNVGGDPASLTKVFDNSANAFASSYSVGSDTVISSTRRFYASNGTTVKAAYSFDGDSGTGISRTAAGRIDFLSSGAVKAYIQTGTSNPISPTMYVDGRTEINDVVTWSGGSSTNANTAYTYSQVGHLPLAGGTMTGELKTRALTIINPVATGRVEIGTIANDQQNGYVRGSVIFSRDENQITFDTTTDQWVHAGGSSTDWSMIAHHSSGVSFYTGSALASSTSYTNAQFASAYRWLEVPTGTKIPDFKVRPTVSGNNIWHAGDFSNNSSNWDSAYTYSQVGHLPLSGGTITGSLTVNNRVSFTDDDITSLSTEINTLNNGGLSIALDANNEVASTDFRVRIDRSSGDSQLVLDASGNLDVENNVTAVSFITGTASSALGIYAGSTQVFEGSTRNLKNLGTINSGSITSTGNITAGTTTGYLYAKSLRLENGEVSDADFQSAYQMIVDANDSLSIMSNKGDFTGGYPFGIFFLGDNGGTTKTLGSGLVGVWNTTNFKKAHVDHMVGLYDNTQDLTAPNISVTGNLDIAQYIRHAGDTNTSIGFTDSDQITVSTGGTARVSITNSDFVFKNTQVQFDSTMGLGASTYSPLESGATSERNWLNFHLTDNASYIEITNRTPSGKVVLSGGLDGGGGEVQRLEIEGGSGTQDVRLLTSTNLDITAGNLKLNNIIRINNAGNATFGTISGSALTVTNSGMPTLTLYDNGNGGGGASEAKIQFQNTAGTAIAIGYTDDSSVDSDLVISTNAAGTYGGYLGLSAAAIADAQSDIILEPKTDVRIATGGLKVGTDTVISSTRRVYASSGTSVKAALSFDGDSGTGLSNTTSGQIDFLSSGAVKAYIRTGTTNPISDTMYVDGQLGVNGNVVWSGGTSTNANTAYGWGDHSAAGYLGTNDNITVGTISCGAISSTGSSLINTLQVGANTNQNAYGRLQVNQSANVDEAGIGILSQNAGRSMRLWVDETHSYINSGNAGSGFLYLNEDVRVTNEGNFERTGSHISGCQIGGYDAIANSREKSNPIHVIGSNYLPTETSTNNNMYGIGFTRGSGYFSDLSWTNGDGWGLYASAGAARIFLDAENGVLESTGGIAINGTVFCDAARDISVRDIVAAGTVSSSAGTVGTAANILSIKTSTEANTAAGDVYAGIRFQVSGAENSTGTISDNTVAAIKAIDYRSGTTSFEDAGLGFYTLDTDESAHTFRGGFSNAGGFFVSVDGNVDQNTGEGDIYADSNVSAGNNIVFNNQLRFASDTLIDNQKTFYINTISITDGDFAVIDENNTGENNIIWRDYSADRLYLGTTTDVVEFRGDVNFQSGHTLSHDGNIILDAARNVANLGTIASNRVTATVNSAIEYSTTEDSELNAVGSDALFLFNSENTSTNGKVSIMMRNAGGGGTATGRITLKNERSGNSGFGFFLRDGSHTANQQEKMFLDSDGDLSITGAFTSSGAIVGSTVQATGNLFGTNGLHTLNTAGNAWDHTINRNGGNPTANLPGGITSGAITSSGAVTASNFIGTGNLTVTGNAHELGAGSNQTVFLDFKSTTDAVIELNNSTKITIGTVLTSFTQDISTALGKYHYFGTTAQDTKIGTGLNGRLDFDVNGAGFIRLDGLSSTHEVDILKQLNLNSNNVVGVGTFTSSGLMTVTAGSGAEGITIRGRSSDNISELTFSNNAGSSSIGGLQARNTDMRLRTIGSIPLLLQTDNTERGRLHSTGGLTIGKNSANIGIGAYDSTSIWQHGMITTTVYNHGDVQEPTDEQANGALSGYYSFINSGSVYVGCVEPNTVIYEYDPSNGAEKVFAVRGPEDASSVTVVADRIYRSRNQPFVMHLNGDHSAMVPLAYTGQYFGFYTNRYEPDSVRFYAPDGGCTINVYRDNGINSGTVDQTITLLPQEAKTTALTSASGYFVFEVVGGHVIASVTAPSGDRDILRPASRIRVFGDNSFGIGGDYEIFSGGGAANDSNRVVYSQDEPVIASKIGDGDGGDCLTGVPLQMLCDNYLIPHSVAGMSYVAVYPDTEIKTYYHNGTTWVLAESKSLDGRLLTADDDQVGNMDSGGSSHINSGGRTIWVTGNKPFMASTNDPGADEYELVGWLSKYRAVAPAEPRVMALSGGTQTDPAVTFENDYDTGIYRNADNKIGFTAGGTVRATIATDGIVTSGNVTAYGSPSDIRLKENVERIADPIDKVKQLDGITFDYKKDGSRSTGLIAQQLLEVLPEVVYQTDDIETGNTHYAVRYGQVVGLLVEAVKELTQRIEELENGDN